MNGAATPLERGREELGAARALLDAGFPAQALARAYFAGFHAATAALIAQGESPATAAGVLAAFSRHVADGDGITTEDARALRKLFEDRRDVDYALAQVPPEEAREALAAAERLVEITTAFVQARR